MMAPSSTARGDPSREFEHLSVDDFLQNLVDARALKTAFELHLIEHLLESQPSTLEELERAIGADQPALRLLLDMLLANRVVEEFDGSFRLTERFRVALRYRDLLETKLDLAGFATLDFVGFFTALIADPGGFQRQARLFEFFDYQRCLHSSHENYEWTKRWVKVTTTLTRYEARACLQHHDFGRYQRMLDVGGNSGEFAIRICRENPGIRATVMDLPLVCEVGQQHILTEPERDRIGFVKGNALEDPLPVGFDLVTFKSMLHDWPEEEAKRLIAKASQSLDPGGTFLIFERGPIRARGETLPFSMIPILLFSNSYRSPSVYEDALKGLGLHDIEIQEIALETPFFLVTATKG